MKLFHLLVPAVLLGSEAHRVWVGQVPSVGQPAAQVVVGTPPGEEEEDVRADSGVGSDPTQDGGKHSKPINSKTFRNEIFNLQLEINVMRFILKEKKYEEKKRIKGKIRVEENIKIKQK